jgi:hypothetical protein
MESTTSTNASQLHEAKKTYVAVQIQRNGRYYGKQFSGDLADAIRSLCVAGSSGVRIETISLSCITSLRCHFFALRAFGAEDGSIRLALAQPDAIKLVEPSLRGVL